MNTSKKNGFLPKVGFLLKLTLATVTLFILTLPTDTSCGDRRPIQPGPRDKCPVCGMFVYKYPDWVAQILFKDGSYALFDGTKDMFKYYFNLQKYHPSKKAADIDSIYVTDYYDLTPIDGYKAYYVEGGDVYGPMGKELIPFEKEGAAKEFMKDHKGKSILKFPDVHPERISRLD
jgi:nitrous oxide reductase accessory protein NosL